ncbi:MAG: YkgJ family cysteine cluster protein [Planctomycetales bacterium]
MADKPWYKNGLRFKCTQCGDCCTGSEGYVWVNKKEIEQLAALLDIDIESFEKSYVRTIGIRKSLNEYANGDCVFFDSKERVCNVYQARPRQCRSWPFWDSTVRTPEAWEETCDACPGSGKGKLYSLEKIEEHRSQIKI